MLVDFAFSARKALPRKRRTNEVQVLGSFGRARGEGKWQNCPRTIGPLTIIAFDSLWTGSFSWTHPDSTLKEKRCWPLWYLPLCSWGGEKAQNGYAPPPPPWASCYKIISSSERLLLRTRLMLGLLNHIPIKLVYKYVHQSPEHPAKRQTLIQHVWWWCRKDIS